MLGRIEFVFAKVVTRFGRKTTRMTRILIIESKFTFTFTLRVHAMNVYLRPSIHLL